MPLNILVTGGAGYIGSHTTLALLQAGHKVVVFDNLSNSSRESISRVTTLAGRAPFFVMGDIRDSSLLRHVLVEHEVDAVMHFAGLKAVGDSVLHPLSYYDNNVVGSVQLFQAMQAAGIYRIVFSSSATVYGEAEHIPISEATRLGVPTNPYGWSKWMVENCLQDLARSDARWRIAVLRYFNPGGAHPSGMIGEDPHGTPNNLLPYIAQVAAGRRTHLQIFGDDYPTSDGTGVRDYIHVVDLAEGHLCALKALEKLSGVGVWNLGTGQGTTVLEALHAFEKVSERAVPYKVVPRRPGDIAECWANPEKARLELGWSAKRGITEIMIDAWRWQSGNPFGYRSEDGDSA